jgi:hypothetical protein
MPEVVVLAENDPAIAAATAPPCKNSRRFSGLML